jgi:hypothetical protein
MQASIDAYQKHMNLKLAADEIGVPWQTVYVHLKKAGIPVVGDKLRYGSDRDRLAAMAENKFLELVPFAKGMNLTQYQAKYDFEAGDFKVDVKASRPHQPNKKYPSTCWSFSFKKQSLVCDFIVCFCFSEESDLIHTLLVPKEFFVGLQTVSVTCNGRSKWLDYEVEAKSMADFFGALRSH